jgi:hypothetical protein
MTYPIAPVVMTRISAKPALNGWMTYTGLIKWIQNMKSITDCAHPTDTNADHSRCHAPARDPRTNPALFGLIGRIARLIGALSLGSVIAVDILSLRGTNGITLM